MPAKKKQKKKKRLLWANYTDDALLSLRFKDLDLSVSGSRIEPRVEQLYKELKQKGLRFKPHCWFSSEWFSPDGVPGIAIPFYLAHSRLMQLEAKQMYRVEGGTRGQCMQILRHEAGHAIDTAYRLHYRKRWRELFGKFSDPYPDAYRPNPRSKKHVLHFDDWYAQAHPAEDFAETFAVWLTPRSQWQTTYRHWPVALRKLQYVDELMQEILGKAAPVRSKRRVESTRSMTTTLREHYRRRRRHYGLDRSESVERDLEKLFSADPKYLEHRTAASFLRERKPVASKIVAEWTGADLYTIQQIVQDMIERSRRLKLRLKKNERTSRREFLLMLTVRTMKFMHRRRYEIAL